MKFSVEVKSDKESTVYTVDTTQLERTMEDASKKIERFLKDTFKIDTIKKE